MGNREPSASGPGSAPGPAAVLLAPREAVGWLGIALAGFAVAQLVSFGVLSAVAAIRGVPSAEVKDLASQAVPPEWVVVSLLLGLWIGFIGAPLLATRMGPQRRQLGFEFRAIDLLGIPIGLAAQIGVGLLYLPVRSHLHNFDAPVQKLTGGSTGAGFALIVLLTIFGAPIVEELFFRGLVLRGLTGLGSGTKGRARTWALAGAVVADGALFGLSHGEPVQFFGLALVGMLFAVLTLRTGRLGMSIFAHCTFNALAIATIAVVGG